MAKRPAKKRKKNPFSYLFAKRPNLRSRRRPERMPDPELEQDEDMLSEFSDENNDFYTDEFSIRQRADRKPTSKKDQKREEKRKPISPTRRKIIRILSYTAIVAVILIVGVVLSLTVLFKAQTYDISGNTRYAEEDIVEACGINKGENIFLAPKKPAAKRIKKQFPYVEDVNVSFKIPDTIRISIVEAVEGYLIKKNDTEYLIISTKGRILNQTSDPSAYKLPIFIGPTLTSGEIGDYVSYEDSTVVSMIESVTQTFADNGYDGITSIDATNMADISFTYDNRIKVKLGIPEDLDYKIRTAMIIITNNLDKNQTNTTKGILDVSRCNSTKRSYFNEQEINPTEKKAEVKPTEAVTDDGYSGDGYTGDGYSGDGYTGDGYTDDGYTDDSYDWYADDGGWTDDGNGEW